MIKHIFSKKDIKNDLYFKSLNKVQHSEEYMQNQKQIDYITKVLTENADVPRSLIDSLIEAVQENVALEYECLICKK